MSAWISGSSGKTRFTIETSLGHRGHFLYAEANGEIHGILPLVHVKSRLFGNALISNAFCVYGGVAAADRAAMRALDGRALELGDALGVDHIEYRNRARMHEAKGRQPSALQDFQRAYFLAPSDPNYRAKMKELGLLQ